MQNIKLLDLQTGKYLELGGRGFFYGGDTITCPPIKSFIIKGTDRYIDIYADDIDMYDICKLNNANTDNDVNSGSARIFEITFKSNNQKFVGVRVSNLDDRFNCLFYKTEPQEPLKTLCEKTGAVVYGGRYVLLSCETWLTKDKISVELIQGHIFRRKLSSLKYYEETPIFLIDKETLMKLSGIKDDYTTYSFETSCYSREFLSTTLLKSLFRGNIFEEYSKQLRNEENKFEELTELIK